MNWPAASLTLPAARYAPPSRALAARAAGWAGPCEVLAGGQRPLTGADRLGGIAGRQARGGVFVAGRQGVGVAGPADALAMAGGLVQDGGGVAGLPGGHQRAAEMDLGRDGAGMIWPEHAGAAGQHPLTPADGLRRLPGRQQRGGQLAAGHQRVRVAGSQEPVAAGGQLPPPGDRGAGQPGAGHALPGHQQHPVAAAACPQRIPGDPAQARRAGPQAGGKPGAGLIGRPCLKQRVRRGPHRPAEHLRGDDRPHCCLQCRAHPDRWRGARRADGHQPGPLQGPHRGPGIFGVRRARGALAQVPADRRRDQYGAGNAVAVKNRAQHQQQPATRTWRQLLGMVGGQRPGHRRGGQRPGAARRELRPPPREKLPVITAGQARAGDHRAGLGHRGRLAAKIGGQVDRPAALVRVGDQPAQQAAHRLARAEGRPPAWPAPAARRRPPPDRRP